MIEIISEYIVKDGMQDQFELAYGPGGLWSNLFSQSPGFRGTRVMRDLSNPFRYITIDIWDSEDQYKNALGDHENELSETEIAYQKWVESKTNFGTFGIRAQATVRPRGKKGGSKSRRTLHSNP